jgi:1,4-dihydroxy-2-naphthoyl-CoA hydrolase
MSIWCQPATIEQINARSVGTVNDVLGVRVTEIGADFMRAEMPVDERHVQPFGVVHGGVSVVLAETLGSLAASLCCPPGFHAVGIEVNASHLRPVARGDILRGLCTPVRVGRTLQVWNIELRRGDGELSCVARLTTAMVETRARA